MSPVILSQRAEYSLYARKRKVRHRRECSKGNGELGCGFLATTRLDPTCRMNLPRGLPGIPWTSLVQVGLPLFLLSAECRHGLVVRRESPWFDLYRKHHIRLNCQKVCVTLPPAFFPSCDAAHMVVETVSLVC
jgi:hypothetical protein